MRHLQRSLAILLAFNTAAVWPVIASAALQQDK